MRKNLRGIYLLSLFTLFLPSFSNASTLSSQTLLISEIQTGSLASASEEFIELYNASDEAVDVSDYKVEYYSAATTIFETPSRTVTLHGLVGPGNYYLISSHDYLADLAEDHFSAGLAKTGGHIRLIGGESEVIDLIGWGTAVSPEGSASSAPNGGESLQRKLDDSGSMIDSDKNALDFAINSAPTPQHNELLALPELLPAEPAVTEPEEEPEPSESLLEQASAGLLNPQITELLPNPASPQTDAEDEFVELYNPNTETLDLAGYKLQTGTSYSYSFIFDNQVLPANGHQAFYVSLTDALLANSGGRARLINPNGQVISESAAYEEAKEGESWAFINGQWQWTTSATPSAENLLTLPQVLVKKSTAATKKTAKKPSKTKKTAKSNRKASAPTDRAVYDEPAEAAPPPLNTSVLAGIGGLTLAYGVGEYKNDVINRLRQFRRNRAARGTLRRTP